MRPRKPTLDHHVGVKSGQLCVAVKFAAQRRGDGSGLAVADRFAVDADHRQHDLAGSRHESLTRRERVLERKWPLVERDAEPSVTKPPLSTNQASRAPCSFAICFASTLGSSDTDLMSTRAQRLSGTVTTVTPLAASRSPRS